MKGPHCLQGGRQPTCFDVSAVGRDVTALTCPPDCYQSEVESGSFMIVD